MPNAVIRAALLLIVTNPALAADPVFAEPMLDRVTLSSGGVGQFEFTADVEGTATLPLAVPLDQVDDLLKSLRVDDPAGGLPSLRLPGREPLSESFRPLPFGPAVFNSPEALLGALIGEAVRVPAAGIDGRILAVTPFETALPDGGTITRHRLTIATDTGIATAVLQDVPGVEFEAEALRRQIASALTAIAAQRVQDRRIVRLSLGDGGRRSVRFGYVVPAPVWKASYRLTVPEGDATGLAALQGFAVVENLSGQDWHDVEVLLTSGQPVLYHQPLYAAVFTTRPEAPIEVPNRIDPQPDAGAAPLQSMAQVASPPAPAPSARRLQETEAASTVPPPPSEIRQSVAQVEFRLTGRVTAASGETMLLPIAQRDIPARRVALFQPDADPRHPLVALLLTNDGAGALPPGLVTLFERRADGTSGFIGDARLPVLQPGAERLLSFATDLTVSIDTTRGADSQVTSGRAANGVLELLRRERATTTYRITTPAGSGRTVLIEQPRRDGWDLVTPSRDVGLTPTQYRISRAIPADVTEGIEVVLERPRSERIVLADTGTPRLLAMAQEGRLSPELRAAMSQAAGLRTELDRRNTAARALADRRAAIVADQDRVRKNLAAVPANSELQRRYLSQLQQQETQLATLQAQAETAQRAADDADAALRDYLATLTL